MSSIFLEVRSFCSWDFVYHTSVPVVYVVGSTTRIITGSMTSCRRDDQERRRKRLFQAFADTQYLPLRGGILFRIHRKRPELVSG